MREVLCPVVVGRDEELAVLEQGLEDAFRYVVARA
jgi:hypothetical protein